jgi:Tol biopolymer transport system component
VRRHAKASTAGSNEGNGNSRGLFRRAFTIRAASSDSKGSGAPKAKLALALAGALILILAIGVTLASAISPTVSVEDAKEVSYTSALAKGKVDPQGKETYCHFEYVTDAQFQENLTNGLAGFEFAGGPDCNGNPHEGTGAQNVQANLTGLTPSTVYHLRLVASNEDGQSEAVASNTFETKAVAKPTVTIDPVTTFTGTTAHFSGSIDPNAPDSDPAFKVNWRFECNPGCPGAEGPALGTGNTSQPVQADATGLEPNTTYTVKLVAESPGGSDSAGPVNFKTLATSPDALTIPAFVLEGGTSTLVGGRVNPHNSISTWWIEYGTEKNNYDKSKPATKDAATGSGDEFKFLTQELADLALDTTYHFRVSAKNAQGEVHGEDLTFTTPPPVGPPASCSNAAFRTGPSAVLPDCRAYENVTPLNLLGAKDISATRVAENGEAVLFKIFASLPGFEASGSSDTYLAKRTAGDWNSTLASPPGSMTPFRQANLVFATPNLDGRMVWETLNAVNPEDPDPASIVTQFNDLYRSEPDGSFTWLNRGSDMAPATDGDDVIYLGASADGLKVYFADGRQYESDAPNGGIYIRSGQTTSVVKDENGATLPAPRRNLPAFDLTDDGSALAFVYNAAGVPHLYLYEQNLGHAVLVANSATLISLTADGSKIIFTTGEDLVPGDVDQGSDPYSAPRDIYEYEVDTGDFRRLSGTVAGPGPGNGKASANPVLASRDGSTVYFTSTERLDGAKGVSGETNLYRAEGGAIHYAMTLSGEPQNPRLTRGGKKLLFASSDRLTAYDNVANGVAHTEIYAYDSADGSTVCASCRPSGEVPSGDAGFGDKWSADQQGERIFFQSTDAVLPQDVNGKADVYEFDASGNTTSLISTGESPAPSNLAGNSADGRDVFFFSVDSLRPHDQNVGTQKLFDARIGGGFAEPPPPAVCEGEGCRGAGSAKPADAAPATPSFSGPGNPKPKHAKKHKAKKHKHKSHKKHQSKSHKRAANSNGRTGR